MAEFLPDIAAESLQDIVGPVSPGESDQEINVIAGVRLTGKSLVVGSYCGRSRRIGGTATG
jgi:hypothetical protein